MKNILSTYLGTFVDALKDRNNQEEIQRLYKISLHREEVFNRAKNMQTVSTTEMWLR